MRSKDSKKYLVIEPESDNIIYGATYTKDGIVPRTTSEAVLGMCSFSLRTPVKLPNMIERKGVLLLPTNLAYFADTMKR